MCMFFADGRQERRVHERVRVAIPCTIYYEDYKIPGITRNASEGGLSILVDKPYYFPKKGKLKIVFDDDRDNNGICPIVYAKVVYSNQVGDKWNYSMKIRSFGNSKKSTFDEYLLMLYDRDPIFPEEINEESGVLKDLKRNAEERLNRKEEEDRTHPRVTIEKTMHYVMNEEALKNGESLIDKTVYVVDYNFCYICVKKVDLSLPQSFCLLIDETHNCYLKCEFEKTLSHGMLLYKVVNIDQISYNVKRMTRLQDWMVECHKEAEGTKIADRDSRK